MSDRDTLYESLSQWMQSLELNGDGCVGCAYLYEEHETETCPASLSCEGSVRDCPRVERAVFEVFCGR